MSATCRVVGKIAQEIHAMTVYVSHTGPPLGMDDLGRPNKQRIGSMGHESVCDLNYKTSVSICILTPHTNERYTRGGGENKINIKRKL